MLHAIIESCIDACIGGGGSQASDRLNFSRGEKKVPKNSDISEEYKLFLRKVGDGIAQARREKGISQRVLGQSAAKNPAMIAKVEKFAPANISMRNIFEVARLIPVSLGEIILKAERDLDLHSEPLAENKFDDRMKQLMQKVAALPSEEQKWMADMIEGLLVRTSSSPDLH